MVKFDISVKKIIKTAYTIVFKEAGRTKYHYNLSEEKYNELLAVMLNQEGG